LFMGKDTHALSGPAERTALEVLAANEVEVCIQEGGGFTPTPSISRAILAHNRAHPERLADGVVITPSHNPPADGGFKYNPPHGGPADTDVTGWVQERANAVARGGNAGVKRISYERALRAATTHQVDLIIAVCDGVVGGDRFEVIRSAECGLGGSAGWGQPAYWEPIQRRYGIDLTVVNTRVDPQFGFMTLDHDGKIRMDCSSPYAMAGLIG
jgi:phosphoglucomutase